MKKIWVIADVPETAFELLSKARQFGTQITAYLAGDQETAVQALSYGADVVKLMKLPSHTVWEQYSALLAQEAQAVQPELILVNASSRGKDLAAQLAAKLDCPCCSECKKLEQADGNLAMQRIVYGGLANKEIESHVFPFVLTVSAGTFQKDEPEEGRSGEVTSLALPEQSPIQLLERKPKAASTVNLKEASVVVGVGRGVADPKMLESAGELAKLLGGELGCTRPLAEDLKWLPEERYIGISGQQIKPQLYLGAGVSGQIQHVYGIRDSKVIAAINNNENAPIFQVSDYYIVGNLEEVIPALMTALQSE
jgi:electron transfer flavoprotein alpha subunit